MPRGSLKVSKRSAVAHALRAQRGKACSLFPRAKVNVADCSLHKIAQNSLTKMVSPFAGKLESEFEEGSQPDA